MLKLQIDRHISLVVSRSFEDRRREGGLKITLFYPGIKADLRGFSPLILFSLDTMNKVTSRYYELQKKRIITSDVRNDTVRSNLSMTERGVE